MFERDEAGGGLVRFGVPDFKIEKTVVERRIGQLVAEGVEFRYGVDVGVDLDAAELREAYDAVVVATGARVPRDLPVPGRELDGVHFAMEYLYQRNRWAARELGPQVAGAPAVPKHVISAAGKHVIVIGGGDTGADCVANSTREGAASVTQLELVGEPPASRPDAITPWPRWPMKLRTPYALKENGHRDFAISTTKFTGEDGRVNAIHWAQNSGTPPFELVAGTDESHPAGLVLLAMGFLGPEALPLDQLGVEKDERSNAKAPTHATSVDGVFAAGDARRGQSLIVWAINEGRRCAQAVDRWLCQSAAQRRLTLKQPLPRSKPSLRERGEYPLTVLRMSLLPPWRITQHDLQAGRLLHSGPALLSEQGGRARPGAHTPGPVDSFRGEPRAALCSC